MSSHLKTRGQLIVDQNNQITYLRGINLGGWLMMEAYFMHSPNLAVHRFKKNFKKELGESALRDFEKRFRDHFIQEQDIRHIKKMGLNCVRVPFNYRLVEEAPFKISRKGVKYLDQIIAWTKKYKIFTILDMHAAPGAQNYDWHSDSDGRARLWGSSRNKKRALAIWEYLADRYKDEKYVVGYDLLNEAVTDNIEELNGFYKNIIKVIRSTGSQQILFIEGNNWATDLDCLDQFEDDNYVLSIHNYAPVDFTFNFVPQLKYPLKTKKYKWSKATTRRHLKQYQKSITTHKVPVFVGEFGVNARGGVYGEDQWLAETLEEFNRLNFHWTYWTYKAIKNSGYPDGLMSYRDNPPWVNRSGPIAGWDTYHLHWTKSKCEMTESWLTKNFEPNVELIETLKKYAN